MDENKRYALLDTDFLYKSHLAKNKTNQTLADLIIKFEEYDFFCHEMIREELTRHEVFPDPNPWLEDRIKDGKVKIYSDSDIICELSKVYGASASNMYLTLLELSCEVFNAGFFEMYYGSLRELQVTENMEVFLAALHECDQNIPHQKGLGEKKTYVLIQMMQILHSKRVYVFCSDDFKARQSIASLTDPVYCISILGIFYKLMKMGYGKSVMQEYYDHLSAFLKNQTEYKVWSLSGHQRMSVPIQQAFDEMYEGKFQLLKNGDLRYMN